MKVHLQAASIKDDVLIYLACEFSRQNTLPDFGNVSIPSRAADGLEPRGQSQGLRVGELPEFLDRRVTLDHVAGK